MSEKKLRNDCFALPPGVHWTPVDEVHAALRARLSTVVGVETLPLDQAAGRVLAARVQAARSNPPYPNSAIDGYGFAYFAAETYELPLVQGRAAAGQPFRGSVPQGHAIRILTGAMLPEGVDTVVLQEDTTITEGRVQFSSGLKPRANTRRAGEDVLAGAELFAAGQRITAPDLALMAATGVRSVSVCKPLRVGVLSTGDEVVPAGSQAAPHQIFDANRPMLLELISRFGMVPVDLGHVMDDAEKVRDALTEGAGRVDAILTSGGASAGDEDHVSTALKSRDSLAIWRVAVKPGRPLALGVWDGVPVFGLPGNPVAAMVCTLVFARPALQQLAGETARPPQGYMLPAAFTKRKKPGRREYLRARRTADGAVEVFPSEGSGRISGLSWAEGLVELPDGAIDVGTGTPVRFIPYADFGL